MPTPIQIPHVLLCGLLFAVPAAAQIPGELLGSWVGSSESNRGEKLTIEAKSITIGDERMELALQAPGVLVFGGADGQRAEFTVLGDTLTLTVDGESMQYARVGPAKKPATGDGERREAPQTRPTPAPGTNPLGNPLGKGMGKLPAADPFARTFRGTDIELTLQGGAADGYRGTLAFQGKSYPAEATATGQQLRGRFRVDAEWYEFTAELTGDHLKLSSAGSDYELEAPPLPHEDAPKNPLARGIGGAAGVAGSATAAPPALEGVYAGECTPYKHPRGWFDFDMPQGWSVYSESAVGMLLNPGLRETDTLDAIVGLMWGRLEPQDQNQPVGKIIEKRLPALRSSLAEQGLQVPAGDDKVTTWRGKDVPGAVIVLRAQTQGGVPVQVWLGGIVRADAWIVVSGVVMDAKVEQYVPKLKRIFTTLVARPPEHDAKAEGELVGRTFASDQNGRIVGSTHSASYEFTAGGTVTRRLMSFVSPTPGLPGASTDSSSSGAYEVQGDILYLYLQSGQETAQIVRQGGRIAAIRIGAAEYR